MRDFCRPGAPQRMRDFEGQSTNVKCTGIMRKEIRELYNKEERRMRIVI